MTPENTTKISCINRLTPWEREFLILFRDEEPRPDPHHPDHIENETIALMIEHLGHRRYFLNRLTVSDFKNKFNRAIFAAIESVSEPVDIVKIYDQLRAERMAMRGIAEHLGMLNGLTTPDTNPFPKRTTKWT